MLEYYATADSNDRSGGREAEIIFTRGPETDCTLLVRRNADADI